MRKIVLFLILFIKLQTIYANTPADSLLQKYRKMAIKYNHDLKSAERNIAASIEFVKSAKDDRKPKLSGGANFQYIGNPTELTLNMPIFDSPLSFRGQELNYGIALSLMQPIYTGGRVLEAIRLSQEQQVLATNTFDLILANVCFQTDIQYWNTVACLELTSIYEASYQSITTLKQMLEERVKVGVSDPQDLLMVEVRLNESHYNLLRSQSNLQTNFMALNSLIGSDLNKILEIDTILKDSVSTAFLSTTNNDNRPEIRIANSEIDIQQSVLNINDAQYKPQFYIGAEGSYSSPGYNFKKDLNPNYALYAKLSVPIFHWGKRKSDKTAYKHKVEMAQDNLNKVRDGVALEIVKAETNLIQSKQRVELTKNSLEKAEENEQKSIESYTQGRMSIVELIDAQVYKQTTQINFVQAKLAMQSYFTDLLKALNQYTTD
ncbi:MAG: TolC family protein [Bacteroidales bacterium]